MQSSGAQDEKCWLRRTLSLFPSSNPPLPIMASLQGSRASWRLKGELFPFWTLHTTRPVCLGVWLVLGGYLAQHPAQGSD